MPGLLRRLALIVVIAFAGAAAVLWLGAYVAALETAIRNDPDQRHRSACMSLFALRWLPGQLLAFNNLALMRDLLYRDHPEDARAEYLRLFAEPGAITGALNWYRGGFGLPVYASLVVRPPSCSSGAGRTRPLAQPPLPAGGSTCPPSSPKWRSTAGAG